VKRNLMLLLVTGCLIVMNSCAAMNAKRGVIDNRFFSTYSPEISISVHEELLYKGVTKHFQSDLFRMQSSKETCERYDFENTGRTRYFSVRILRLKDRNWHYLAASTGSIPNTLFKGQEVLGGKKYESCVFAGKSEGKPVLVKLLVRNVAYNVRIVMFYVEEAGTYKGWQQPLSSEQKKTLDTFLNRSREAISVDTEPPAGGLSAT